MWHTEKSIFLFQFNSVIFEVTFKTTNVFLQMQLHIVLFSFHVILCARKFYI